MTLPASTSLVSLDIGSINNSVFKTCLGGGRRGREEGEGGGGEPRQGDTSLSSLVEK